MDYFTLRALAREWDAAFASATIEDAWTQSPRELSLALARGDDRRTVRVICDPALALLFQTEGVGRQRRNAADVLDGLAGRTVMGVYTAERDRHVCVRLEGGDRLQIVLFGSRPNVFWTDAAGTVRAAFLDGDAWAGEPAPAPRPAPVVETAEAFEARWRPRKTLGQTVAGAVPLLTRALADEAVRRAGLDPGADPAPLDADARRAAFEAAQAFLDALEAPAPHLYWRGDLVEAFALVPLAAPPPTWRAEAFETVDAALRVYARRRLGQRAYDALYTPAERALAAAAARRQRSADAMLEELSQPSRADRYERWGHLLMASAAGEGPGRDTVTLPDIIGDGAPVEIPLDPARSAVENAERYYDKARRTRRARESAESRWGDVQAEAEAAQGLLDRLRATDSVAALREVLDAESTAFAAFVGQRGEAGPSEPFHRIALPGGFEALVGKHARGNAHLTTRVASPHDLWLHARGVPGSHVVVKRAGRTAEVPPPTIRAAARVAAHFSTAKTQTVVPVTVTERKYVRPVKGGPPGLVRVDREDVVDVSPGLPG